MEMKKFLLPLFLLFASLLLSQSSVDSLKALLHNQVPDTTQVRLLNELGLAYTYFLTDSALVYTRHGLSIAENIDFAAGVAKSRFQLTLIHRLLGNYPEALNNGFESLKYYTEVQRKPDIAGVLTNLGGVYFRLQDYDKALGYYEKSLKIRLELGDEIGQATQFVGLGLVYENIHQYEKALTYYLQALAINRRNAPPLNTAINLVNIGDLYLNQDQYEEALPYFFESLGINRKINNQQGVASVTRHLAQLYQKTGDLKRSIKYAETSLEVAIKIKRKIIASEASLVLSENYSNIKDYRKALEFYHIHTKYNDSLYSATKLKELSSLESRYRVQQKEQELKIKEQTIALLESDKQISRLWRNILMASLFILTLIGFLIYKFLKTNSRKDKALIRTQWVNTQQLEALDKAKSRFFANISHEFRTPLTLIKGPIERLEQSPEEPLSMDTIKMIRRNSNRVLKLVNQLLELSKIDEGNLKLEPTEGDIYKCLRAATSSFNSHAAQRNIDYRVQIPQTVLWASFDRDKLEKITYNLLSNAFKFSIDGAVISVEGKYGEKGLEIQVSDSGMGIPEEELPFIFDRFFQVDSSSTKEHEGSGIGLSLSKSLVEFMDGAITVTSKEGKGSVFVVQLPILQIKTGQKESVLAGGNMKGIVSKPAPFELTKEDKRDVPRILLVEDNDDMRHFIKESLILEYKITEAINGLAGLKKSIADPPDLIITDLMMPKMDGIELCKKLKTDVHTSHIPIIMLTARAGVDNKIVGLETGADDYLTKPFDAKELMARTKNLIMQRLKLRELYINTDVQIDPKKITVTSIDQKFLEQVLALLEDNSANSDFGVPQMQQTLGMSKTQINRKIKALTNETPGELLRNFRLKKAAQLLLQKADSVTQIAYKVGFNNLSYFAKCFKEVYGVAPSAY